MPSIGNIVVKRISQHRLLPPVYEPIVKGLALKVEQVAEIVHHALPSLIGAGGQSPKPHKEVFKTISQSVVVGAGAVNRIKTSGVVGHSYTQASFTFESYTLVAGAARAKTLTENISITEPLAVQRVKTRRIFEDAPELTELSATLTIERTKARALSQTELIDETLTVLPHTAIRQTLSETNDITESVTTVKESKRSRVETVSESGDVTITLPGVKLSITETEEISDSVVRQITYAIGHIANELIEDVSISDAVSPTITKTRAALGIVPLADNLTGLVTTGITSYTFTSFTSQSYRIFTELRTEKILVQTVDESHTLRIAKTKNRSVPTQTTEIIDSVGGIRISPNDVIVRDEVVMKVGRGRRLTENVNIIG
jgi:hypothetical protein